MRLAPIKFLRACLREHSASIALPFPTLPPSTFDAGTLTSLKVTVAVSNPFIPSFSGPFCTLTPVTRKVNSLTLLGNLYRVTHLDGKKPTDDIDLECSTILPGQ